MPLVDWIVAGGAWLAAATAAPLICAVAAPCPRRQPRALPPGTPIRGELIPRSEQ